jgi:hypothetical protein
MRLLVASKNITSIVNILRPADRGRGLRSREDLLAGWTLEWLFFCVGSDVPVEVFSANEGRCTDSASESSLLRGFCGGGAG